MATTVVGPSEVLVVGLGVLPYTNSHGEGSGDIEH